MKFDGVRPTRVEVYLDAITHNFREIKKIVGKNVKIMAVIKGDAYGHGASYVAKFLEKEGVDYFGVATTEEALELREKGIKTPILIFGYTPPTQLRQIVKHDLTQTVYDIKYAKELEKESLKQNKRAKVHIKIDTGLGRIGYIDFDLAQKEILEMANMRGLILEGIYSHFAAASEDDRDYCKEQFDKFMNLISSLEKKRLKIPLKHIANAAAILNLNYSHLDMVRPGIILFGAYPSKRVERKVELRETLRFTTRVVHLKDVPAGFFIGYGKSFVTKRKSVIATIPVGYADGLDRRLSNNYKLLLKGKYVPIVGRVCMDQCMIDVTDVEGVEIGDEVVIIGTQNNETVSVESMADKIETIPQEVFSRISRRVPRVYFYDGIKIGEVNYLK
ncbi:alanine racemase [Caldanaerobacter subterraneus subsp. tengcongensis MB4]|uniref:Alanine racemase 1 n=1 Tax=Caldanaerobacter subterraneus subsp. tengcongensis (strain DSM 15242 / JCM 11007 / NBRC 100824 / MB4) TaxID=273068 RepID=ALR1_CALS4|nr:alanine racemase [Caldanaerobacter subterraneus]Q8RAK6.1 RecName: Full=Alanine racemase 1 [Caldanaerobacter subterraneus subsp. tengcongensis MB4]AAM24437.1 Alanine racemase [Caldanaerobacter subterraneus subsp. tengcongensis MB4]MCS3916005.1 alanine racemase [Caldanaerobacter subterraneus subsp. tengcongensis MB4]